MTYEPGTQLASQDELGAMFFVVVSGEADVLINGQHRKRLGPGEYFGEMSMIDRAPVRPTSWQLPPCGAWCSPSGSSGPS